jgi:hypothetical protein
MKILIIKSCKRCPYYVLNIFDEKICVKYNKEITERSGIAGFCKLKECEEETECIY